MRKHHLTAFFVLLGGPAFAADGVTTIANPGGGTIAYAQLPQQHTTQGAMGKVLQYAKSKFGARPDIDKVMQSPDGNSVAVTFTVGPAGASQIAGLALVAVSPTGPGAGAVLSDKADHLRTSLKPMLDRLQQEAVAKGGSAQAQAAIGNASGSPSASASKSTAKTDTKSGAPAAPAADGTIKATAPAQKLIQTNFPDGSGSVGLPAGWRITSAREGDVTAEGPNGENMRFGMNQEAIDYRNPQSRALGRGPGGTAPGNYVAIPFGTPGDAAYKQMLAQLAQKSRKAAPPIDYTLVKPLNTTGGGKAYFLQANITSASGPAVTWIQEFESTMGPMGVWTISIYGVTVPQALAGKEMATALAMIPSYKSNNNVILREGGNDVKLIQQITADTLRKNGQLLDASARSTQATTNYLLNQTVVSDSALNAHGTVSDDVANALIAANPNRFQAVSSGSFVKGIDY